ncbi:MAG: Lrp/AsnC family transcriptional regulator [Deltaproteobacteria bacterium]|nr:Lrp/AsnC family transcriptional regulator [Deltaproteobacteria bacterium]
MKFERPEPLELDSTDLAILDLLQRNCKLPLAEIGKQVDLTASSVVERIKKLEDAGVVRGYVALVDARAVGKDVTAFIGVSIDHPRAFEPFEREVEGAADVLECHHVTGQHTLMVKVKTDSTATLERLIDQIRRVDGVTRTETMVVLSTHTERTRIALDGLEAPLPRRTRRAPRTRHSGGAPA